MLARECSLEDCSMQLDPGTFALRSENTGERKVPEPGEERGNEKGKGVGKGEGGSVPLTLILQFDHCM